MIAYDLTQFALHPNLIHELGLTQKTTIELRDGLVCVDHLQKLAKHPQSHRSLRQVRLRHF